MEGYEPTIGLEIHAELKTQTKMFCDSPNNPEETRPNFNVCPVCMGHPGTLPVINKEAVKHVLRVGTAVQGELADYTEFDRKNYFYPDIPKGYQISQYKYPLVRGGVLRGVRLTRIHLEEDTAKSTHDSEEAFGESLVDFNRAGVPLMELVTEPVIKSGSDAASFAKELQLLLWYLNVSEANMEKGEMRIEANISVKKVSSDTLGTKVEVKNLNSFKSVERAIQYEIDRQISLLGRGEEVKQETRGWDEVAEKTFSQRSKEESHDYRYFPDPDLPKLCISEIPEFNSVSLHSSLPELPWQKRERFVAKYNVKSDNADLFIRDQLLGDYFVSVVNELTDTEGYRLAENYITSDLQGLGAMPQAKEVAQVILMLLSGEISSRGAKEIFKILVNENTTAREAAVANNLFQKNDEGELETLVSKIISSYPKVVDEYKSGKDSSLQFLIGQVMKESKGSANPQKVRTILEKKLRS